MMRGAGPRRRSADILVVCTGNVCRSPYLAARLAAALPNLLLASAGTHALSGHSPTPPVLAALGRRGVAPQAGPARLLSGGVLRHARLVLTAERAHRVRVTELDASAAGRVFTVKEFARLAAAAPATADLAQLVARAAALAEAEDVDHDDDLADPYGLDDEAYERMFADADAALGLLVPVLSADRASQ